MNSSITQTILRVAEVANLRLSQLARHTGAATRTFQFRDDHFCAVKFTLGNCSAVWEIDGDEIKLFEGDNVVDLIKLAPEQTDIRKAG